MKNYKQIFAFIFTLILYWPIITQAQVSINQDNTSPDSSAMLDIKSSNKGLLIPRMNSIERDAIVNPAPGLMIYNTTDSCFNYFSGIEWFKDCGRTMSADISVLPSIGLAGSNGEDGEGGRAIDADVNGNQYVIGNFGDTINFGNTTLTNPGSGNDIFVLKYNRSGEIVWAKKFGGTSSEFGSSLKLDANGNIHIVGHFYGVGIFGKDTLTSNGKNDIFLAKLDPSGNVLWAKQAGSTQLDYGFDLGLDAAGHVYITGSFRDLIHFGGGNTLFSTGNNDAFLAKYDSSGNFIWAKKAGGSSSDIGRLIAVDKAGNSIIAGRFLGSMTFNSIALGNITLNSNGVTDLFIAKYDPMGNVLWAQKGGGVVTDAPRGIEIDETGNLYISGVFSGTASFGSETINSTGASDIFLAKYNSSGQVSWAKKFGGSQEDSGYGITIDHEGYLYLTGFFSDTVIFDNDTLISNGLRDAFITKFLPSGDPVWAKSGGGTLYDEGHKIASDGVGNIHVIGGFQGTASFGGNTFVQTGSVSELFIWANKWPKW